MKRIVIWVDNQPVEALAEQSIASALWAAGIRCLRRTTKTAAPRGLYCGMGICYECLVVVDSVPNVKACQTMVREGMRIELGGC